MAYVYRHIRLDKNIPFYIGIGSDENFKRACSKHNRSLHWDRIYKKHGYEVEIVIDNISWDLACKKEKEFIKLYGRIDLGEGFLCNKTDGGEGTLNKSAEACNRIAIATRKRLSGVKLPEATKAKMRLRTGSLNPFYGKKHARAIIFSAYSPERELFIFQGTYHAASIIKANRSFIYKFCTGKSKTCKGWSEAKIMLK